LNTRDAAQSAVRNCFAARWLGKAAISLALLFSSSLLLAEADCVESERERESLTVIGVGDIGHHDEVPRPVRRLVPGVRGH